MSYDSLYFKKKQPIEIPVIEDPYGDTALDHALGLEGNKMLKNELQMAKQVSSFEHMKKMFQQARKLKWGEMFGVYDK